MKLKNAVYGAVVVALFLSVGCSQSSGLSARQCYERGVQKLKENNKKKAFDFFKTASQKDTANPLYSWAAAQAAGNKNDAFVNAKESWTKGLKQPQVLFALTALSLHSNKLEALRYALALYDEMPDSLRTAGLRGDIFYRSDQYDSCIAQWGPLYSKKPSGPLCSQIAMAYSKKGDIQKARSLLIEGRGRGILDAQGYIMLCLLSALEFDFSGVDALFQEMHASGLCNASIESEHAGFLLAQERYSEAGKILEKILALPPDSSNGFIKSQARISLDLVYCMTSQPEKIKGLIAQAPEKGPFAKAEKALHKAAMGIYYDSLKAFDEFAVVRKAAPQNAAINLIFARSIGKRGEYEKALEIYDQLPEIFRRSPRTLLERASILQKMGKDDDALALISLMHRHKLFSKTSLELYRDITFKKNMIERSMAAQKILEQHYAGDAGVLWAKGVLALSKNEFDSARAAFAALRQKYPDEEKFETVRILVDMIKKDYERVIKECDASRAPAASLAPLKARALVRLGKNDLARETYLKALSERKTPELLAEYSSFLLEGGLAGQAIPLYEELIKMSKENPKTDKKEIAMYFNNFAWSLLQADSTSPKRLLWAAKQAYALAPEDLHIIDTYCEALIRSAQYGDCIKMLKSNPATAQEPRLLFHLATAFEKNGDINLACRTYSQALALADSTRKLPCNFTKEELVAHINRIKQ